MCSFIADQFQSLSDPLPKTRYIQLKYLYSVNFYRNGFITTSFSFRLLEIIAYGPDRTPPMDETPMEIMTY